MAAIASFEKQTDAELFGAAGAGFSFTDFLDESACAPATSLAPFAESPLTDGSPLSSLPMSLTASVQSTAGSSSPATLASALDTSPLFGVEGTPPTPFETFLGFESSLCGPSPASFANAFSHAKPTAAPAVSSPLQESMSFNPALLATFSPATETSSLASPVVQDVTVPSAIEAARQVKVVGKKRVYTGTRNTTIPPIAMDAPAMPKKYALPSATSRKALPTKQARKLAERLAAAAAKSSPAPEDEIPVDGPPAKRPRGRPRKTPSPDVDAAVASLSAYAAGDADLPEDMQAEIDANRKRNRDAARESRRRKAAAMQELQDEVEQLKRERDTAAASMDALAARNAELEEQVQQLRAFYA